MIPLQRLGRVEGQDLAVVDDADPVAALDLLDVVGGHQHGDLPLGAQPAEIGPDALAGLGVEPDRRLVEQQDLGIVDQRPGDLEPALHARGQRPHRLVGPVGQLDQRQHFLDALPPQLARHAEHQPVQVEVLANRQPVVEARLLEDDAETAGGRRAAA